MIFDPDYDVPTRIIAEKLGKKIEEEIVKQGLAAKRDAPSLFLDVRENWMELDADTDYALSVTDEIVRVDCTVTLHLRRNDLPKLIDSIKGPARQSKLGPEDPLSAVAEIVSSALEQSELGRGLWWEHGMSTGYAEGQAVPPEHPLPHE